MPTKTERQRLDQLESSIRRQERILLSIEDQYKDARELKGKLLLEYAELRYGVKPGTLVQKTRTSWKTKEVIKFTPVYQVVHVIAFSLDKPWVKVVGRLKNGDWGARRISLYQSWALTDEG